MKFLISWFLIVVLITAHKSQKLNQGAECNIHTTGEACEAAGCEWDTKDAEDGLLGECGEYDAEEVAAAAASGDGPNHKLKTAVTGTSGTTAQVECDDYATKETCPSPSCTWVLDEEEGECEETNDVDPEDLHPETDLRLQTHATTSGSSSTGSTETGSTVTSSTITNSSTGSTTTGSTATNSSTGNSAASGGVNPTAENEACDSVTVMSTCTSTQGCYWVENKCQGEAPENENCEGLSETVCNTTAGCTFEDFECEAAEFDERNEVICEHRLKPDCDTTTGCFWKIDGESGECDQGFLPKTTLKKTNAQKNFVGMPGMGGMAGMGEDMCEMLGYDQCVATPSCNWDMEDRECEVMKYRGPMGGMAGQYRGVLQSHKTVGSLNCSQYKTEGDCEVVRGCDFENGLCVADEIDFECGHLMTEVSCGQDTRCMWDKTEAELDENTEGECKKKEETEANEPGDFECGHLLSVETCSADARCFWDTTEAEVDENTQGECKSKKETPEAPEAGETAETDFECGHLINETTCTNDTRCFWDKTEAEIDENTNGECKSKKEAPEAGETAEVDFECGHLLTAATCGSDTRCFWDITEAEIDENTNGECKSKKEAPEAGEIAKVECGIHRNKTDCEIISSCIWESELDDGLTGECDERDHILPGTSTNSGSSTNSGTGTNTGTNTNTNSHDVEEGEHCERIFAATECSSAQGCFWDGEECENEPVLKHVHLKQTQTAGSETTSANFWIYLGLSVLFVFVVPFVALKCFSRYMKKQQNVGVYDLQLDEPLNESSFVV